ncbi:MAG: ATP-dependent DNA helicase [Elusimicrobiota bacterium]|nr:ATP-dependent DNA helicase [Elusimicrobiota bacterium]
MQKPSSEINPAPSIKMNEVYCSNTLASNVNHINRSCGVKKILSELNKNQQLAVTHTEGPLLIIAGAGTGKTRVITYRIAYLIAKKLARPSEILALTFTEKAASEMSTRVDILVPYGFNDVWISTFHAFGDKILRENAILLGLSPEFRVLTQPEAIVFFREHLFEFQMEKFRPLGNPTWYISSILDTISRAKDEDVTADEYIRFAEEYLKKSDTKEDKEKSAKQLEIGNIYKKYEELKLKNNFIDFGDQVILTLKLFREHKDVLLKYQQKYKYILIDEFQDTNYSQFELSKLLAESHRNITAVADDDQSIYKFRGACLSNVLGFKNFYQDAKIITLTENYRSTQSILNTAYRVIVHNNPERLEVREKIKKKLKAARKIHGAPVTHLHFDTVHTEADNVAKIIKDKVDNSSYNYKDFAILVRSNDLAVPFLKSLNACGIPWTFSGSRSLTDRDEIKFLIAFLRVIANPNDSRSLYYLLTSHKQVFPKSKVFGEIPTLELIQLNNLARVHNRSLFYIISNLDKFSTSPEVEISQNTKDVLTNFLSDIKHYIKLSQELPTERLLYTFLKDKKILVELATAESIEKTEQAQNVAKFFQLISNFSELTEYNRVVNFVEYANSLFEGIDSASATSDEQLLGEFELDYDAVQVLTIHKAKGLEFPVVFLVGIVEDKFPTRQQYDPVELPEALIKDILPAGDYHIQEERRLFYVGMTRAKDELYLTSANYYAGAKKPKKVSRFIQEALDVPVVDVKAVAPSVREQLERYAPPAAPVQATARTTLSLGATHSHNRSSLLSLSPYAIDDYLTCPLKYKYIHILRIPLPKHHTLVFGEIIHKVLKEYHTAVKESKKVTLEQLIDIYNKLWTSEGFLSREHEEKQYERGKRIITDYYNFQEKTGVIPAGVEEEFKFVVDGNIKIKGRWDRLNVETVNGNIERTIIDYKTSEGIVDEKEAEKETKQSRQLVIYALGHKEKYGSLPDYVSLHFLDSGISSKVKIKDKSLKRVLKEIQQVAEGIRSGIFKASPGYFSCEFCPYSSICSKTV